MEKFYLDSYLAGQPDYAESETNFDSICRKIALDFMREWEESKDEANRILEIQKKAIIGYEKEVQYFKNRIAELLRNYRAENTPYPAWYARLEDAVYHENWGLAGVAQWFGAEYRESSSAKVIGDRIYFMKDGEMKLQPQRISRERREQLVRAFLLLTPEERLDKEFHEIYMLDGTRITVFRGGMTKEGEDVIIFRRYIIPSYSFEEQAARGTIPEKSIALFRSMVEVGYNVAFCGAVRSAKTTFLSTWQSYEDERLEGVMVETDPEIPLHKIMPAAPIVQLVADQEKLRNISKNLLRSDADYFVLAEARDGIALDTAVRMARKGTRRMKMTFHTRDPLWFSYDVAVEIVRSMGGEIDETAIGVAGGFDYVFHFIQLKQKNQKRLKGIYELGLEPDTRRIVMHEICRYRHESDDWCWNFKISDDKRRLGLEENAEAFARFEGLLANLAMEGA